MKLFTTTALALVALVSAPAAAQSYGSTAQQPSRLPPQQQNNEAKPAEAQPKITPSKGALKAIVELQDAVNKNDYASVPAKVAAANAVAKTKEDRYLIGQFQLKGAVAAKDNAGMASAIETLASSGYLDSAKASDLYVALGGTYYNAKQYPQAAASYQKAIALSPSNTEALSLLGESMIAQGDKAGAASVFQRAVQAKVAAGQKPDEALLKRAVAVAYDVQSPTSIELAREWVSAYPSPSSWSDAIAIYSNLHHPDVEGTLDLLRLKQSTGALKSGSEYAQYIRAAADQNNYNEAQAALDAAVAANLIDPKKAEYSDLANLKSKPKATAADLAEATKTAQSGMALLRIGDRYASMGDYAKAVELYRMSMGKPGVDSEVANLHIGMALVRAGDKAGATAALKAVTGPRADIAKFWLTYLNQRA
jgi:tetratricopeptide (TPR) repeat protein